MLHKLLNSLNHSSSTKHKHDDPSEHEIPFVVEALEERLMLSFVGFFDGITLDLVQTGDDGDIIIDNNGLGGAFRAIDNADTLTFVDAQNVSVKLLPNTFNQLNFNIVTSHTGNVLIDLDNGARDLVFGGALNTIDGNLEVLGGNGVQNVNFGGGTAHTTQGDVSVDLGNGFDRAFNNDFSLTFGSNVSFVGVNEFIYSDLGDNDALLTVGGNFTMDVSNESVESFLTEIDTGDDTLNSTISGNFTYIGGDDIDHVSLNNTDIGGDLTALLDLGTPFFGDPQDLTTLEDADIGGNTLIVAGDANLGNTVSLQGTFAGDVDIELGESNLGNQVITNATFGGDLSITIDDSVSGNDVLLNGAFNGNLVTMELSDTEDFVDYNLVGTQADVVANLNAGDDTFILNQVVNQLNVDFGNDPFDEFVNNIGRFTFDVFLTNLHFFDHLYTVADDTLTLTQVGDTGDITIDNDGGPGFGTDWRLFTEIGGLTSTTAANNLTLNMLDNTGNNVEIDLFNPVISFLTLNLGEGDRSLEFTGASNNPLRDITITAGAGVQNVDLAINASLAVATLNVDLGDGFDTVRNNGNNLLVSEDFIFTGVNMFRNDANLSIARDAIISTANENIDSIFANDSTIFVGRDFSFTGGDGADRVNLNGPDGNSFSGNVNIDLGGNTNPGMQTAWLNGPFTSIAGNLIVSSSGDVGTDYFITTANTEIGGLIDVSLGDGNNQADILGMISGEFVNYSGGIGSDIVTFGTTGNPVDLDVFLGAGDDSFTLLAGASLDGNLMIDFGPGNDEFVNLNGSFEFDATLLNLDGFDHIYDFSEESLTSTQVADFGPITVDDNGLNNAIRFIDGGTNVITPVRNVSVHLLSDSATDLNIRFDNGLAGDLLLELNDGVRQVNFDGFDNSIGGDLTITAGQGSQTVELAVINGLSVGGQAVIDLGLSTDIVDGDGNNIDIGSSLELIGVNRFRNDGVTNVGGALLVDNINETNLSFFDNNGTLTIGANFRYTGGIAQDLVLLDGPGGTTIGGDVVIRIGDNMTGGEQTVRFNDLTQIDGSVFVKSTAAVNADNFISTALTQFGSDLTVNLGDGPNQATVLGQFTGDDFVYVGGSGIDLVSYGLTGSQVAVNAILGAGDDTFTLNPGVTLDSLRIDFGGGIDQFVNDLGQFNFDADLVNWIGFNRHYSVANDTLRLTQTADVGNITIDNNGVDNAIRILAGSTTELTAAAHVRVDLISNTGNLEIDYDSAQSGDTIINLQNGDRVVRFTGDSNEIGGTLRIDAGQFDDQDIHLADNASLVVGGSVVINLRGGNDLIDEGSNNLFIDNNLILRSVNSFRNDNTVMIGGNLTMNTRFDNVSSILQNSGTFVLDGSLGYYGGSGFDRVFLQNSTLSGTTNIQLGTGNDTQVADFSGSTLGRLRVDADTTIGINRVTTSASTNVASEVLVIMSGATNTNVVDLQGNYGGTYGTFRGGSGTDQVTFGATAENMNFVARTAGGEDRYTLESGSDLLQTIIDGGAGMDDFVDEFNGVHPFTVLERNLP